MNPVTHGLRIALVPDAFPKGFSVSQLNDIMYQLSATSEDAALMCEAESLAVMDSAYNPGERTSKMILDAVTARYSRLPKTMAAFQRVLNKHFRAIGSDITAETPMLGDPKKGSMFATITVQFPFSDGQVLSVVFHAPGGDPKKVMPDDTLIAFRWLLNKRDITQVVAPEVESGKARDVSLDTVGKRITQLVDANSEKFQKRQADVAATRKELEDSKAAVETLEDQQQALTGEIAELGSTGQELDQVIASQETRLAELKEQNADLEAELEGLRQKKNSPDDVDLERLKGIRGQRYLDEYIEDNFSFGNQKISELVKASTQKKETQKYVHIIELYNTIWESAADQGYHATKAGLERVFGDYLGVNDYDARSISNKRTSLARDLKPVSIDFTFEDMLTRKVSKSAFMDVAIKKDDGGGLQTQDLEQLASKLKSMGFNEPTISDEGFENSLHAYKHNDSKRVAVDIYNADTTGFYAKMKTSLYQYNNYENGDSGEYRTQEKMLGHLTDLLEEWGMSGDMQGGTDKKNNPPPSELDEKTRNKLLNEVWKKAHKDQRSTIDGARYITMLTNDGTSLVPLKNLTDSQIKEKVGKETWDKYTQSPDNNSKHYYGLKFRPASIGAVPKGPYTVISPETAKTDPDVASVIKGHPESAYRHGVIVYDHALTEDEISSYELWDFSIPPLLRNEDHRAEALSELAMQMDAAIERGDSFDTFFKEVAMSKGQEHPFYNANKGRTDYDAMTLALREYDGNPKTSPKAILEKYWKELSEGFGHSTGGNSDKSDITNLWVGSAASTEEAVKAIKGFQNLKQGDMAYSVKATKSGEAPVVAKKQARKIVDNDGISHAIKDLTGLSTSQINEALAAIEYESNGGKTVIQPAAKQSGQPAKNVARLLHSLGLQEKVMEGEDFHLRLKNDPYQDLVIERHAMGDEQRLYLTHYYEQGGDQVMDAEMVFSISQTGLLTLVETATTSPRGEMRGLDNSFATMFSKNLNNQGFGDAKTSGSKDSNEMDSAKKESQSETPAAVSTLEGIISGQFDSKTSDEVQDMMMTALEELEALGVAEQHEALFGAAAEKYVELADKEGL